MVYFFAILVPLQAGIRVEFYFDPASVLLAFAAGAIMTFASVALAAWRISRLNVVRAVRDQREPEEHHASLFLGTGAVLAVLGGAGIVYGFFSGYSLGEVARVPLPALGPAGAASPWGPPPWARAAPGLPNPPGQARPGDLL